MTKNAIVFSNARFIKANRKFIWDYQETDLAPMFQKTFDLDRFSCGEVSLCALGFGTFYINGLKITDDLFVSPTSDYEKTLWFTSYDVTPLLKPGKNVIACILGNGWYNESVQTPWEYREAKWRDNPKFILTLKIDGADVVNSDGSWLCKPESHIVFNQLRSGEHFDARLYDPKWNTLGADLVGWEPAIIDDTPPKGELKYSLCPPVGECAVYPAKSVIKTGEKRYVFDIGQNISGYVRLYICQASGDLLWIRYGEQINPDGSLNLNGMDKFYPISHFQTDIFICNGKPFTYSPMFTYHGFQYIEIEGLDEANTSQVSGVFTHSDIPLLTGFECSNYDLNRLFYIGIMANYSNMQYTLTDCPTREKFGWLNDAKASTEQILMNFDSLNFFKKWYADIIDSIRDDGAIPGIAPTSGCLYDTWTGPICSGALFEIPYKIYLYTGDDSIMIDALPSFMKHLAFLKNQKRGDGLIGFGLCDWAGPFDDLRSAPTPVELTDTALYIEFLQRTIFAAERAGNTGTAREVQDELDNVTKTFKKTYINPEGFCTVDEQTAIAMIIELGLYDDLEPLKSQLKDNVERYNFHHNCGMLGLRYLYYALNRCELHEYSYRIITAEGYPSYTKWLRDGATTLWETWQCNDSKNHHMYSDFMLWLMNTLVGIRLDPNKPGMKRIVVSPFFAEDLVYCSGYREMSEGKLKVAWQRNGDKVIVHINVPYGAEIEYASRILSEGNYSFII